MSAITTLCIVLGSLTAYSVVGGIVYEIAYRKLDWSDDGALPAGALWPLFCWFMVATATSRLIANRAMRPKLPPARSL